MRSSINPFKLAQWIIEDDYIKISFYQVEVLCTTDLTQSLPGLCKIELMIDLLPTKNSRELNHNLFQLNVHKIWSRNTLYGLEEVCLDLIKCSLHNAIVKQIMKSMVHLFADITL
jgi:hypothetical protein